MVKDLEHRAAGLDDAIRRQSFAEKVIARNTAVGKVDVADVIDDLAVNLLWDSLVEAAIACLHVKHRDLAPLRRIGGETRIRVAQNEQCVGLDVAENGIDLGDDVAHGLCCTRAHRTKKIVRLANLQIIEEDLVQFVIVILPGVDDDVIVMPIEGGHHSRKPDNLRTGSYYGSYFHGRE